MVDTEDTSDGLGYWTLIQRRGNYGMDPPERFNRTWQEYKDGFGTSEGEFWIGLESIFTITNTDEKYQLKIDLEDWDGSKAFIVVNNFKVSNEANNYRYVHTARSHLYEMFR